jgi:hypothetical protein
VVGAVAIGLGDVPATGSGFGRGALTSDPASDPSARSMSFGEFVLWRGSGVIGSRGPMAFR